MTSTQSQNGPMPRPSDRLLLYLLAGVAIVLLAGMVALLLVGGRKPAEFPEGSPEKVVQQYLLALESGRWDEAYGYLSDSVKSNTLEGKNLKQDYERRVVNHQSSTRIILERSETTGTDATVMVSISTFRSTGPLDTSEHSQRIDFRLRQESGQWKIRSPSYPPYFGALLPGPPSPLEPASVRG